jgi:electron transport complex protein RnfE
MLFAGSDGTGGIRILGDWYSPASIFILPPGAFLTLGFLVALFKFFKDRPAKKAEDNVVEEDATEEVAEEEGVTE